ncbi:EthD domain-containing protein [Lophiotrema nucula]|uniref:EthD domain-containing protein n=1 Tax=Lophiotrema nucula TaxID=690887 RepID=A0A6A5ZRV8_9PLEO|nr:EthD domain-containing protein [Lophiotrema nucula]
MPLFMPRPARVLFGIHSSMVYPLVLFVARKLKVSPAEFREHWENKHVPLSKSIASRTFPLSHTRRYIGRGGDGITAKAGVSTGIGTTSDTPAVLVGRPEEIEWDGYAELTFRDELHFQQFFAKVNESEAAARIQEDEARFSDSTKFKVVIVGDITSTNAD